MTPSPAPAPMAGYHDANDRLLSGPCRRVDPGCQYLSLMGTNACPKHATAAERATFQTYPGTDRNGVVMPAVTTAAEAAEVVFEMETFQRSRLTADGSRFIDGEADDAWRDAAAYEGARYSEAICGGRAYTASANLYRLSTRNPLAYGVEFSAGIPEGWISR